MRWALSQPKNLTNSSTLICRPFFFIVDGGLNEDVAWSICSKSCDNGTSFRHLTCTQPQPFNGGKPCLGNRTRAKDCNQVPCPSNSSYDKYSYNQALA